MYTVLRIYVFCYVRPFTNFSTSHQKKGPKFRDLILISDFVDMFLKSGMTYDLIQVRFKNSINHAQELIYGQVLSLVLALVTLKNPIELSFWFRSTGDTLKLGFNTFNYLNHIADLFCWRRIFVFMLAETKKPFNYGNQKKAKNHDGKKS